MINNALKVLTVMLTATFAGVFLLTGCTQATEAKTVVITKDLKNPTRTVECVATFGQTSAIDCDFENAVKK